MVRRTPLKEIIGTEQELEFFNAMQKFNCRDKDVENFLKEKAIEFDKRRKSRTYLFYDENSDGDIIILGYFALTLKTLKLNPELTKSKIKKIDGFKFDATEAEAVLIGQLGKSSDYGDKLKGKILLDEAVEAIYLCSDIVGGRIAFLECANNPKIVDFYTANGFVFLQASPGGEYLQMIRHL